MERCLRNVVLLLMQFMPMSDEICFNLRWVKGCSLSVFQRISSNSLKMSRILLIVAIIEISYTCLIGISILARRIVIVNTKKERVHAIFKRLFIDMMYKGGEYR